jgi:hypothetical protein
MRLSTVVLPLIILAIPATSRAVPGFESRVEVRFNGARNVIGTTSAILDGDNWVSTNVADMKLEASPPAAAAIGITARSFLTDVYTLQGPVGTTVPVTMILDLDYTITPLIGNYSAKVYTSLTYPPNPGPIPGKEYVQELTGSGYSTSGDPNLDIALVQNWTVGESREVRWGLQTLTTLNVHVNAGNTAHIRFDLPPGYTMTSALGWPGVVPTQSTTWGRLKSLYN